MRSLCLCRAVLLVVPVLEVDAGARSVDLHFDYYAAHTLIPAYNPDLAPDMDGDGFADLTEQVSIQTLLQVLGDELHAEHAATLAAFEHNEALAVAPLIARWGPAQPLIPHLGEVCAVYMTIQGEGTFAGPTHLGMAGRVEELWVMLTLVDYVGSFESQPWQQAPIFAPEPIVPALTVTGDGVVTEGDTVVFTASPADAAAYRWFKDSTLIVGEAASTLTLDPVSLDDAGEYYCELDFPDKATYMTPTVVLVVNEVVEPIVPVLTVSGGVVNEGDAVTFSVSPSDGLAYRWFKDAVRIDGEAAATLVLDPVTLDDAGEYYCEFDMPDKTTYTTPTVVLVVNAINSLSISAWILVAAILAISYRVVGGSRRDSNAQ